MNTHSGSESEENFNKMEVNTEVYQSGSDKVDDDLVKSDSKMPLKTPIKDGETDFQVKFSINDSANGKNKCITESALPSFSGLSKEELLKYADDPFWVRIRLCLFIFFWGVWIAMFVGAIVIIVLAPKCEPPKKPEWYEQGPLYEVDVAKFVAEENSESLFKQMISKLNYLSDLQIKGVVLSPIFKTDGEGEENVIDYKSVDDKLGNLEDFKAFINKAKERGIHIIPSFTPNHSSNKHAWFNKSIAKESPYKDYYIWAPASGLNSDGSKVPPNNWLSVKGGSAWEWVNEREEFYLHQFDVNQPDLNYNNPHVLKEMQDVLSFWINMGVSGFNLDKVQYLLENTDLQNEIPGGKPGAIHTQYEFYSHKQTHNIPGVADILSSWRQLIQEKTDKGVLIVTGDVPIPTDSNSSTVIVDIQRSDRLLKNLSNDFTAKDLHSRLQKIIESPEKWPSVQLGDRFMSRVADLFGDESVDGLNMITLLLKATPITFFGEELGLSDQTPFRWGNETKGVLAQQEADQSHYKVYKALIEARDSQTILYGNSSLEVLNDTVLILTRIKLGNPGYLVAYNPSLQNLTLNLSELEFIPNDLMVYTKSVDFPLELASGKDKVKSRNVFLAAKAGIVFTFAPKTEE